MQENLEEKRERKVPRSILTFIVLTAACIVFAVLCIHYTQIAFINKHVILFSILSAVLLAVLCGFSVWLVLKKKETLAKTLISVYIFILFCLVLIFILQITGFFNVIKDEQSLQKYLEKSGAWMPFVYILLQYLQVVILPIPSVVSTVAGVALFGPFKTVIYSYIGIWLGSVTAFFIGRKLGYKAVAWMIGEDTLKKWQKKLKGKDNLILTLMFLLPVFPDDVLCFIAGLSTMSNGYFLTMISISRILSISTTCYSVDLIPFNTWWGLLIWAVLIIAFVVVFTLIYKNLDKIQNALAKRFKVFRKKSRKNKKDE